MALIVFFLLCSCRSRRTVHFLGRITIMQPQTWTNLAHEYFRQHHARRRCSNHSVRFKNSNFTENIHLVRAKKSWDFENALQWLELQSHWATRRGDLSQWIVLLPPFPCALTHWNFRMLPHEKTEILGCKSVKLLYFIPMLPTVIQFTRDLTYCNQSAN